MTSGRSKEGWFVPVKPTSRHNRGRAAAIAAVTVVTLAALCPRLALAHERWVKHDAKPFDRGFFQSMTGQMLELAPAATAAAAVIVALWYLSSVPADAR